MDRCIADCTESRIEEGKALLGETETDRNDTGHQKRVGAVEVRYLTRARYASPERQDRSKSAAD